MHWAAHGAGGLIGVVVGVATQLGLSCHFALVAGQFVNQCANVFGNPVAAGGHIDEKVVAGCGLAGVLIYHGIEWVFKSVSPRE
jgi:hypothetical protein